ncbi:MAG: ABC transporter ATP-binding protein [Hyphomicrobiales bacterium]
MSGERLLTIEALRVAFRTRAGDVTVVRDLSLALDGGETLCLVGESGSGKSMTALAVMGLVPAPTGAIRGGSIRLAGEELVGADPERLRRIRGKEIAMIFQEPMTALNPVFSIGEQIAETLVAHEGLGRAAALRQAVELIAAVGIPAPERRIREYPHQLSGGMRQRAMIAMALACRPKLVIADEPTTALDVTVQAQILDLLKDIQRRFGTAILLITHDMGVVAEVADRVAVMYAGRKVEEGRAADVLERPVHPYTRALIACAPRLTVGDGERELLEEIPGIVPSMLSLPPGCAFEPRCRDALPRCRIEAPPEFPLGPHRRSACWLMSTEKVA